MYVVRALERIDAHGEMNELKLAWQTRRLRELFGSNSDVPGIIDELEERKILDIRTYNLTEEEKVEHAIRIAELRDKNRQKPLTFEQLNKLFPEFIKESDARRKIHEIHMETYK